MEIALVIIGVIALLIVLQRLGVIPTFGNTSEHHSHVTHEIETDIIYSGELEKDSADQRQAESEVMLDQEVGTDGLYGSKDRRDK